MKSYRKRFMAMITRKNKSKKNHTRKHRGCKKCKKMMRGG